jgi:hypothetical protein
MLGSSGYIGTAQSATISGFCRKFDRRKATFSHGGVVYVMVKSSPAGTDVMNFKIFSQKNFGTLTQNTASFAKFGP